MSEADFERHRNGGGTERTSLQTKTVCAEDLLQVAYDKNKFDDQTLMARARSCRDALNTLLDATNDSEETTLAVRNDNGQVMLRMPRRGR